MEQLDALLQQLAHMPWWLACVTIVLASFVSEDLAVIGAGLAAAAQMLPTPVALAAAVFGVWIGDIGLWWIGRGARAAVLERRSFSRLVDPETVERCRRGFEKNRLAWILLTRVLPGTRTPTYVLAGALGIPLRWFAFATLAAVALWTPLLFFAAVWLGDDAMALAERAGAAAWITLPLLWIAFWIATRVVLPLFRWKGRRLLLGRIRRVVHWEFWPAWCVYPPVVVAILLLALRHRSLRCVTAANPAMPASGFVGESKSAILRGLAPAGDAIARHCALPCSRSVEERLESLRAFLRDNQLDFPVVLKPDAGQRGAGVSIVRDESAARAYLERIQVDCLAQEYVEGEEFGVFYVREPGASQGRIFSITKKQFPHVTGDGASTFETLVLADPRAVCMAQHYLRTASVAKDSIPANGERVRLAEIGNHCRGTIFLDGRELLTPELASAIDRIARSYDGFHFGRFDLRAPSEEHFRRGVGIRVLELNGATSEATHIYDRKHGILHAWRTLCAQWRILFAIGKANAKAGAKTTGPLELWRAWRAYGRDSASHPVHTNAAANHTPPHP